MTIGATPSTAYNYEGVVGKINGYDATAAHPALQLSSSLLRTVVHLHKTYVAKQALVKPSTLFSAYCHKVSWPTSSPTPQLVQSA